MKIVITGFMGCGKSRIARELARRLNLTMVDLDERITEKEGRSPAQLIVEEGEKTFRSIESAVLRDSLQADNARVIALGGGAWIENRNRDLIKEYGYSSVWLDAPFEICWARIETSGEDRPLGRTKEQAQTLYDQRRPIYQLADVRIQIGNEDFDELISKIARSFRQD
ncbi:MAG TPA: shikimate kinase [Pyrinomonadaceae bacterium]|nr:shikimate kinase [Pyrinomonadaceae bacterium]